MNILTLSIITLTLAFIAMIVAVVALVRFFRSERTKADFRRAVWWVAGAFVVAWLIYLGLPSALAWLIPIQR